MTESNLPPSGSTPPPSGNPPPPIDYGTDQRGPAYTGPAPSKDDITMAMLCHLLAIFTWFVGPLVIWLIKKDSSAFVDDQGKESLNFQLTTTIACAVCAPLICVFGIGALLIIAIHIARLILTIIGTVNANKGVAYRYPLTWRMIK